MIINDTLLALKVQALFYTNVPFYWLVSMWTRLVRIFPLLERVHKLKFLQERCSTVQKSSKK